MAEAWKAMETWVASHFNGKRRGPDYGGRDAEGNPIGHNDIICDGYSIEVKSWKVPSWKAMYTDAVKATQRKEHPDDIALAVFHWKGHPRRTHTLVAMTWEEWEQVKSIIDDYWS